MGESASKYRYLFDSQPYKRGCASRFASPRNGGVGPTFISTPRPAVPGHPDKYFCSAHAAMQNFVSPAIPPKANKKSCAEIRAERPPKARAEITRRNLRRNFCAEIFVLFCIVTIRFRRTWGSFCLRRNALFLVRRNSFPGSVLGSVLGSGLGSFVNSPTTAARGERDQGDRGRRGWVPGEVGAGCPSIENDGLGSRRRRSWGGNIGGRYPLPQF